MPVRNGAGFIRDSLGDIAKGLEPRDELLVVDDGSEDGTREILARLGEMTPQLRVERTHGLGLVKALELGLREASYRWIARADADDRYPASRLNFQRAAIGSNVALVTGDYRLCPQDAASTYLPCALGHPFVALGLINPQRIPHPGVLFRREAVLEAGGYQAEDFPAEDLGLWMRLSEVGRFVGVPRVAVDWSLNPGSVSHIRQAEQRRRTAEMLAPFRPSWLNLVDEAAIDGELTRYAAASHGSERALLLLRDLRAWQAKAVKIPGHAAVLRNLMGHPLSSLTSGLRLRRDSRSRDRWRRSHSGSPR